MGKLEDGRGRRTASDVGEGRGKGMRAGRIGGLVNDGETVKTKAKEDGEIKNKMNVR